MNKIYITMILLSIKAVSGDIETFSQKFENYLEVRYDQVSGNSFYNSNGELKISDLKDSTFFEGEEDEVPLEIQSLYNRNFTNFTLNYQYYIFENLNVNGNVSFRNDVLDAKDLLNFLDTLGQPVEGERDYPKKEQSLFMPISVNAEYFISKEKIYSSVLAGVDIPFGEFDPFADSTLNGNGFGNFNLGFLIGYETETAYFQLYTRYISYLSRIEDQINIRMSIDLYSVENVDFFARLDYLHNLTEIEPNTFNAAIPNSNFRSLIFTGGASIKYHDFRFKILFMPTVSGSNIFDFRGWGLSLAYRFNSGTEIKK